MTAALTRLISLAREFLRGQLPLTELVDQLEVRDVSSQGCSDFRNRARGLSGR